MKTNGISNALLQAHVHEMGLEAFLKQLEQVFDRCHQDTQDFDYPLISAQYADAYCEVQEMRRKIFPKHKTNVPGADNE